MQKGRSSVPAKPPFFWNETELVDGDGVLLPSVSGEGAAKLLQLALLCSPLHNWLQYITNGSAKYVHSVIFSPLFMMACWTIWYSQNHHPASVFTVHSVTMSHINDGHQLKTSSSAVFQNWGLALNSGKVVSRVPPSKTNVISSHCSFPGLRAGPQFRKSGQPGTPSEKKTAIWRGKTKKNWTYFFFRLYDTRKKYILQKNWTKTVNPALSSDSNFLHPAIGGHHHQLDDHYRNPNINTEII